MGREMKDSGVEWVGKIPNNWSFIKSKYIFSQKNKRGNKDNLQLLTPSQKYGVIPQTLYEELSGMVAVKLKEDTNFSLLKTIHNGDFCISLRSFQGGFEYCKYEGVVSPAYQVFSADIPVCNDYYKYLFKDKSFIEKINSYTLSLRDGKNIAFSDFGYTEIPVPPLKEQLLIANFLDKECSEIDNLTADIEKQISLLEDYKKSIITEAVTKGLDPNVEMKDSGVEWIGKISKNFKLSKVKYELECPMKYGATESGVEFSEELPRYIRITDISANNKLKEENKLSLTWQQAKPYMLVKNSVLFARSGATVGKTFLYKTDYGNMAFAGYLISAIPNETKMYAKWLYYFSISNSYKEWSNLIFTQATIQNISAEKYSNLFIPIPNLGEQNRIINFLDKKCSEIDSLISDKKEQLEKLSSYKQSMIYEYVTGKKEVPTQEIA